MGERVELTRRRVVRVEIEFADGEVQQLTGDDANRYQGIVIEQSVHAFIHGVHTPSLPWKQIKPPGET